MPMTDLNLITTLTPHGPAAAIMLSDEQVAQLSPAKAFPVLVSINGKEARLRLSRMGGANMIGFSKAVRAQLGVEPGEQVQATIAVDVAERTVELPPALAAALDTDPAAKAAFEALSYTRRKELARGISEAKQEATKQRRLASALEELAG